jgi:uncharacterized protein YndB with AHSA1/START domain
VAYAAREFGVSAHRVFAVLADPNTYPRWLHGAAAMRDIDDDWPRVGSRFHHRVGIGPLSLADSTELLEIEADRRLRLAVRARPLVSAVVTFSLGGDGDRCLVAFQEEPAPRAIGNVVRPLLDPVTHVRNHLSLKRLAALPELRTGP